MITHSNAQKSLNDLKPSTRRLESVLGVNAKTVERLIAKNLYQRLRLHFTPRPEWTLIEYVDHAKTVFRVNSSSRIEPRI